MHNSGGGSTRCICPILLTPSTIAPTATTCVHLDAARISFNLNLIRSTHTHTLSEHVLVSRLLQALLFVRKAPLIKFRVKLKDIIQMTVTFYLRFYISGVFIDTIFFVSRVCFLVQFKSIQPPGNRLFTGDYQNTLQPLFIVCPPTVVSEIVILRLLCAHLTPILLQNAPYHS